MVGYKQRLEIAMAANSPAPATRGPLVSNLFAELLRLWGTGHLSATAVQKVAHAATLDGISNDNVMKLAKLGSWGQHSSNVHRDLLTFLEMDLPKPVSVSAPAYDSKLATPETVCDLPILLPHEFVSHLATKFPEQYAVLLGITKANDFWKQIHPDDPRLVGPFSECKRMRCVIPLWLHGDGVEFTSDSLMCFSWGSMLCQDASLDNSFLAAAWPKSATTKEGAGTWHDAHHVLAWSFKALWEGKHPTHDWQGNRIRSAIAGTRLTPDGARFAVWQLVGDLEYMANILKLPHWNKDNFCWLCNCSRSDPTKSCMDVGHVPGWTELTVDEMVANPASNHPFFNVIPGPAPALRVALDVLHTVDLGYASTLSASVLHCWCFPDGGTVANAHSIVSDIWALLKEAYQNLGTRDRLNNFKLGFFCNADKPWESAPAMKTKGAETRHLVPALALVGAMLGKRTEVDIRCCAALENLGKFYLEIEGQGMFMSAISAERARTWLMTSLRDYKWLREYFGESNLRFPLRPKFHWCISLAVANSKILGRNGLTRMKIGWDGWLCWRTVCRMALDQ